MLSYLRHHPIKWFVVGSPSGNFAEILERAGYLRLAREDDGPIELLRVIRRRR